MKFLLGTILLGLISINANAESAKFSSAGFSIDILDDKASNAGSQPLMMALPAVNGFAANVNVQIQPYPGSVEDYKKLSSAQFLQLGLETITSSTKGNEIIFEYTGSLQGNMLHFYAKAIKVGDLFYLATATDLASQWPNTGKKLKSVVDSFEIE